MSEAKNKNATTKRTTSGKGATTTAAVQDVVAQACHLGEVTAILRSVSTEFISRFNGDGHKLPELLLQRRGSGPRPATVEVIIAAEMALEGLAREFDARARALLNLPVDVGEKEDLPQSVESFGFEQVVHRDHLESALRSAIPKKTSGS